MEHDIGGRLGDAFGMDQDGLLEVLAREAKRLGEAHELPQLPTALPCCDRACLTQNCTVLYCWYGQRQDYMLRKGAEEARNQLPELLDAAEKGESTIITRRGRPIAVLAPVAALGAVIGQQPLMPLQGSGRGLWGKDSARTIRRLRDEWNR